MATRSKTKVVHTPKPTVPPKQTLQQTTRPKPKASQAIIIPLSVLLIFAAILAFRPISGPPKHIKIPIFGTTRHPKVRILLFSHSTLISLTTNSPLRLESIFCIIEPRIPHHGSISPVMRAHPLPGVF